MRVLFSNPPWWVSEGTAQTPDGQTVHGAFAGVRAGSRWPFTFFQQSLPDRFKFGDYLPYPFFMGYAASYLDQLEGVSVTLRDSIALRESYVSFFGYLQDHRFDYIVIESATPSWETDSKIIAAIKQIQSHTKIIVTGPISSEGERLLVDHDIHAVVKGEYEKGVTRVIQGESGVIDHDLLTLEEMNASPFPYFDNNTAHRYWDPNPQGQQAPQAQVWASRGCPFKCIFCVWPATMTGDDPDGTGRRRVRQYSPEYMEAFITELVERYGYRSIYFDDDTFNLGNAHVVKICEVMDRIGLPWSAMCRADTIRMETWQIMKDAGCFGVKIGVESGNQFVVDKIVNKHLDLNYTRQVVHHLKAIGMTVHGTFTYGLPGETKDQMLDTKKFIADLPFDTVQESGTAEIEGTPLHTLSKTGTLADYEGASMNSDYVRSTDGNKKWMKLAEGLREGTASAIDEVTVADR